MKFIFSYNGLKTQNRYLDLFISSSFQGVNRLFVLSFKDEDCWESYEQCYFPTLEIKDYNVTINRWKNFFKQAIKMI